MSDIVTPSPLQVDESPWWHRKLEPEQRQRIMRDLAIQKPQRWELRFGIMLALSVVIAVMGLQLNSPAIVIGAMLLAPLMQPVLASAGCLALGLLGKAWSSIIRVVLATAGSVAIAYILAAILPEQIGFGTEITSRTIPEGRDLIVALAAGAAGAYATVREDASSSLPGVAVAVALVPPLGTLGILLQAGEFSLAWGSFVLYSTNLIAIVLVGVLVFVITGFVPAQRLEANRARVILSVIAMATLITVIGWSLVQASRGVADDSRDDALATELVEDWLSDTDSIDNVSLDEESILVQLRGTGSAPDDDSLVEILQANFPGRLPLIEWDQVSLPTTTTPTTLTPDEDYELEVEAFVSDWLDAMPDASLSGFFLDEDSVRVDASGVGEPPSVAELSQLLQTEFGNSFSVRINWSERISVSSDQGIDPVIQVTDQLDRITNDWATVQGVSVDGTALAISSSASEYTVSVRGPEAPDIDNLESDLQAFFETVEEQLQAGSAISSDDLDDTDGSDESGLEITVLFASQVEL